MGWFVALIVYALLLSLGYLFISGAWELEERARRFEEHNDNSSSGEQIGG